MTLNTASHNYVMISICQEYFLSVFKQVRNFLVDDWTIAAALLKMMIIMQDATL